MKNAFNVHRPQSIQIGFGGGEDRSDVADAGISHQHIAPPVLGDQLFAQLPTGDAIGNITAMRGSASQQASDFSRDLFGRSYITIDDGDHRPRRGQSADDGGADARSAARDHRIFTLK